MHEVSSKDKEHAISRQLGQNSELRHITIFDDATHKKRGKGASQSLPFNGHHFLYSFMVVVGMV